ncbi:MAG TPA: hypothetical protein VJ953_10155 [Saprospiraceae bacterium]|nr:hypothetical protein [Saprospiraceae bacterium]
MQNLNEKELRDTKGGNIIIQIIDWGTRTYLKWKTIKESNYPIGPVDTDPQ